MMLSTLLLAETGNRVRGAAAEEFGKMDPTGIAMTMIAMTVVFIALIMLYLTFKYIAKLYNVDMKKRFRKSRPDAEVPEILEDIPGETLAAISLALHLYHQQMQGLEDAVMTFKNASKTYSPWSSKIYGLRRTPNQ
jgi:Na+-transporting methylmalonyl-CoA/oxaloacetate decarboxylase gamma subunit